MTGIRSSSGRFTYSLWSKPRVEAADSWTVDDLLGHLRNDLDLDVTMVVQGAKMIYVAALPMHEMRKSKP